MILDKNLKNLGAALMPILLAGALFTPAVWTFRAGEDTEDRHYKPPDPPAARDLIPARKWMVEKQISHPRDSRTPVRSRIVLEAMGAVPRHVFVPAEKLRYAYDDNPVPIGHAQTISQPYMVARITELLELKPDSRVLEVGTGSGYQAAVLAHITPHVYSIEILEPLYKRARATLEEQGYRTVRCRRGDGYLGWPEEAPFDGIIVSCAAEHLPEPLWEQLKPGGRIVIPIGGRNEIQRLVVVMKTEEGERESKTITLVRFVPLTREKEPPGKKKDGQEEPTPEPASKKP